LSHSTAMVDMIDDAIDFLSFDPETLKLQLIQLGERHVTYGVNPDYFPTMAKAIQHAMSAVLGDDFSLEHRKAWTVVLDFMISEMIVGVEKKTQSRHERAFEYTFDTETTHTADNINYNNVMDVTMSWARLKEIENYKDVAGESIFLSIFELRPEARTLFSFGASEIIKSNPQFWKHAHTMVDMIDCAVAFLGPDLEPLEEDLLELGRRHVGYGVTPEYLPTMGYALFITLEKMLGNKFQKSDKESWQCVFQFIISKMIVGIQQAS